jgi:curved DNA-binding protein CbpA
LIRRDLLERGVLERLLFTLFLLRHFDVGTAAFPVGAERRTMTPSGIPHVPVSMLAPPPAAAPPAGAPAASVTPAADANDPLRREAEQRSQALKQSYYEVLGVPQDAAPSAIASAYFQLAKRWHPDRLGAEYADLRDTAMRIFARIGEAHAVLADADQRKQYDELVKTGEGAAEEQEQVQKVLRAATNFQKAQVMLRRNNLPGAEEAARAALADAPDEADHIALVAWLDSMKPGADLDARLRELNRAVKMEEGNLRARWYRGQLLKRVGRERQAIEDFRLIAEKDPRHLDAQREIRLFEMQARTRKSTGGGAGGDRRSDAGQSRHPSPPPADRSSFFGKLFKK